ncbi:MAG: TIGR01906 family membrane protein [Chloroflexi bacterium]|nr:TIGR01906 family membrane protein [Chloroflexota bacterium]MCH8009668.1 TIGR01906 family membrane protein [Chloroflexota bacterium]
MGFARQIAALLFIVALPVALITTTVRVVLNEPRLYEYATDHYDTTATTGIERSELLRASGELRDYFNNSDESIFISVQRNGSPISLFNPRETAHLRDVKALFQLTFRVQEVAVLFVLAYVVTVFIWAKEGTFRSLAMQVLTSGLVTLVVVGALGVVAVSGFEGAFTQFHVIAFDNDFWKLNPSRDHLIQMFPEAFWQDVSIWVGLGTLAEIGTLGLLSAIYLRATRSSRVSVTLPAGVQPFS